MNGTQILHLESNWKRWKEHRRKLRKFREETEKSPERIIARSRLGWAGKTYVYNRDWERETGKQKRMVERNQWRQSKSWARDCVNNQEISNEQEWPPSGVTGVTTQWCDRVTTQWCDRVTTQWCDRVTTQWCDRVTTQWCDRVTTQWCDRVTQWDSNRFSHVTTLNQSSRGQKTVNRTHCV